MTTTEPATEAPASTVETDDEGEAIDVGSFVKQPEVDADLSELGEETVDRPETVEVDRSNAGEHVEESAGVLARVDETPPADLAVIPAEDEIRGLLVLARVLADSALVPSALRGKPHDVALVLLTGRELRISPTAALRGIHPIDGKPSLSPALKQAVVRDRGLGRVVPASGNDATRATWIAYEPAPSGSGWVEICRLTVRWSDVENVTYRVSGGKTAHLVDKENWRNYPARMLSARCRGWLIDDVWPEAAFGLYAPDELDAFTDENGDPIDVASYEHVPDGYRRDPAEDPDAKATEDDVAGLRARIDALPRSARKALGDRWKQAKVSGEGLDRVEFGTMRNRHLRMASSLIAGVEGQVRAGRFDGDDEEPVEAVVVPSGDVVDDRTCDLCSKPYEDCECGDDDAGVEDAEIVYGPGEEPFD